MGTVRWEAAVVDEDGRELTGRQFLIMEVGLSPEKTMRITGRRTRLDVVKAGTPVAIRVFAVESSADIWYFDVPGDFPKVKEAETLNIDADWTADETQFFAHPDPTPAPLRLRETTT